MWHEIVNLEPALLAFRIGVERREHCCAALYAHPPVERSTLGSVLLPLPEFRIAQANLGFRD